MLLEYGHAEIEWEGVKYRLSPTFANMSKIGSPVEIIEDFKSFISTMNVVHKFNIAINVLNACCDKEIPSSLVGRVQFSERRNKFLYVKPAHSLPMLIDVITLAEHCFLHGICGKTYNKQSTGEPLKTFDAYEYMELARVHLGLSLSEASNMTMTEFVRMMDAKFPPEKSDQLTKEENNELLSWFEEQNKVH